MELLQGITDEKIAHVCHGAITGWQDVISDPRPSDPWYAMPSWHRQAVVEGARKAAMGYTPEQLHVAWCEYYWALGWKYGPQRDYAKKEHPNLRPWRELSPEEQFKDILFQAVVTAIVINSES